MDGSSANRNVWSAALPQAKSESVTGWSAQMYTAFVGVNHSWPGWNALLWCARISSARKVISDFPFANVLIPHNLQIEPGIRHWRPGPPEARSMHSRIALPANLSAFHISIRMGITQPGFRNAKSGSGSSIVAMV